VQPVPQNVGQLAEGQLLWHQEFHFVQVWQVPLAPVITVKMSKNSCGISELKRKVYFYVWKSGTDATGNIQSFEPVGKRKNTSAAKKVEKYSTINITLITTINLLNKVSSFRIKNIKIVGLKHVLHRFFMKRNKEMVCKNGS
jgi:hypothetical protein